LLLYYQSTNLYNNGKQVEGFLFFSPSVVSISIILHSVDKPRRKDRERKEEKLEPKLKQIKIEIKNFYL